MIAAAAAVQRPAEAKLLAVDAGGHLRHVPRSGLVDLLRPRDLVVANDAATLPASLFGAHQPTGRAVEVRLASRESLEGEAIRRVVAVVFGAGDYRTPTEDRPAPPALRPGHRLRLGPLRAVVRRLLDHPRLVELDFEGSVAQIWAGLAAHGRPVQYAHLQEDLALWDVWTRVASRPVAFEPPSAGFLVDWSWLAELARRGVAFATLTHAAGLSSTGDPELDLRLPLDEPYEIPEATVQAIADARAAGGRIVALGTTVTRALEHAASAGELRPGPGLAIQRIGPATELGVVDALVSGIHQPGESHYELLRAFADDLLLRRITAALRVGSYRNHEFGDSVFLERQKRS